MSCGDIPDWYLRHRVPVLDVSTETWRMVRRDILPKGYSRDTCTRRLVAAKRLRPVVRGRFLVLDPVREVPAIAIASGLFAERAHYVTTDAVFEFHRLIDQPVPEIIVAMPESHRRIDIGGATVRPVTVAAARFATADVVHTTMRDGGYRLALASVEQAIADAVTHPRWSMHYSLLPEILARPREYDLGALVQIVGARGQAASLRLNDLLHEAGIDVPTDPGPDHGTDHPSNAQRHG
jgi:hypothetical protein